MNTLKTPSLRSLVIRASVLLGLGLGVVHAADSASLIANGNFETASKDQSWVEGWTRPKGGEAVRVTEDGGSHLKLTATEPNLNLMAYKLAPLHAGVKAVEFSMRARVTGLHVGDKAWFDARVILDFKNEAGAKIKGGKAVTFRKDTDGWVTRKVSFLVPEGAVAIEVMPTLSQVVSGSFEFDDLTLTEIDPALVK